MDMETIYFLCVTAWLYAWQLKGCCCVPAGTFLWFKHSCSFGLYLQTVVSRELIYFDPSIWYVPGCSRSSTGHTGMWPHQCWTNKQELLHMFLMLPSERTLLFGCVSVYWGPMVGTDPGVKEGQHFPVVQKTPELYIYLLIFASSLFHCTKSSSKGTLPLLRNFFSCNFLI